MAIKSFAQILIKNEPHTIEFANTKYPFYEMKVGDVFISEKSKRQTIREIMHNFHRYTDMKFTISRVQNMTSLP